MISAPRSTVRSLVCAVGTLAASSLAAQASPCPVLARDSARAWAAPLDRMVELHSSGASLRTALDLLAARAGVRLSYSSESLPLDREACVPQGRMPLGAALGALLHDVAVQPMTSGGLQVVLAPIRRDVVPLSTQMATLDRVVVTGSATGAAQRGLPYALDIVQGRDLRGAAAPSLAQALNGSIPGLWIWADAPTTQLARYGNMRGASSFGLSTPKVFVDGIELANPLLLTRIAADAIDRIEVIRGPQGAALYGADAISGVVNVQLRHDGAQNGIAEATLRSSAGSSQTDYAPAGVFTQEQTAALRVGTAEKSAGVVMALTSTGPIVPGGGSLQFSTDASARRVTSRTIYSGTARLWAARADAPVNPILTGVGATVPGFRALQAQADQAVTQYTLGGTITHAPDAAWTHTITAGVDGYRLAGVTVDYVPVPSALDSALRSTQGGADKGTFRANSVRRATFGDQHTATVTLAADGALLRDGTSSALPAYRSGPVRGAGSGFSNARWLSTMGVGVQAAVGFSDRVFVTAGLRGERNDGFSFASRFGVLPSIGASVVGERGALSWKMRAAYGAGMRPARTTMRETAWRGMNLGAVAASLEPEKQVGVEGGVDLYWRRNLSLQVTRFDQRASSLIQQVPAAYTSLVTPRDSEDGRWATRPVQYQYALVNLGAITNRGWEFAVRQTAGAFSAAATLSLVDSRVAQVAPGYAGELEAGDRMLGVPGRTTGLSVAWAPRGWQLQLAATQAADWVNYDRLSIASTYLRGGAAARGLTGATLRQYWIAYPEVTRVRASMTRDLTSRLTLRLIGDNLLDRQRGEPDNVTIVPGRTVSAGIAARF